MEFFFGGVNLLSGFFEVVFFRRFFLDAESLSKVVIDSFTDVVVVDIDPVGIPEVELVLRRVRGSVGEMAM